MDLLSDEIINKIREIYLVNQNKTVVSKEDLLKYIAYCNIRLFYNALLKNDNTIPFKMKLRTNIGHLKKYRQLLRSLNVHRGEGFTEVKKVKLAPKRIYTLKLNKNAYTVVPSYVSKQKLLKHINLLMIQNKYFSDDEFNNSKNQRN
ncbi:hypothetical protein NQ317_003722, partial [Molorchus minor]